MNELMNEVNHQFFNTSIDYAYWDTILPNILAKLEADQMAAAKAAEAEEFGPFYGLLGVPPPPSLPEIPSLRDILYNTIFRSYLNVDLPHCPHRSGPLCPPLPTIDITRFPRTFSVHDPLSYCTLKRLGKFYYKQAYERALVPAIIQAFFSDPFKPSEDAVIEGMIAAKIAGTEAARTIISRMLGTEVTLLVYEEMSFSLQKDMIKHLEKVKDKAWYDGCKAAMEARILAFEQAIEDDESWESCLAISRAASLAARNAVRDEALLNHSLYHRARYKNVAFAYNQVHEATMRAALEVLRNEKDLHLILSHVQVARRACFQTAKAMVRNAANLRFYDRGEQLSDILCRFGFYDYVPHGGNALPPIALTTIFMATVDTVATDPDYLFLAGLVLASVIIILI